MTLVDRKTGFLTGGWCRSRTTLAVSRVMVDSLHAHPVHTITVNRGKEFAHARQVEEQLHTSVYFRPAHQTMAAWR